MASRGKFYRNNNKDQEMPAEEISKLIFPAGSTNDISACGRSDAASGTEGTIALYDGETKICVLYWSCPWGETRNYFEVRDRNRKDGYMVSVENWNHGSGALGTIDIEVGKKG